MSGQKIITFPADSKVKMLIADDVRAEASGKAMVIGLYPGDSVTAASPPGFQLSTTNQLAISSICLFWTLAEGEGDFQVELSIKNPVGDITIFPTQKITKDKHGESNIIINISPLLIPKAGDFECSLKLDAAHEYKRSFTVKVT